MQGDSKPNELETEEHKGKGTRVDVTENIASETDESVADHLPQVKGIGTMLCNCLFCIRLCSAVFSLYSFCFGIFL